MKSAQQEE